MFCGATSLGDGRIAPMQAVTGFRFDVHRNTFAKVFSFVGIYWRKQIWHVTFIFVVTTLASVADVLMPLFAGRLVDAMSAGAQNGSLSQGRAISALVIFAALGLSSLLLRQIAFAGISLLSLKTMTAMASDAIYKVQRLSTDWHDTNFVGSTVRKITRAVWALDAFGDTVLISLFPTLVVLVGTTLVFGVLWPVLGIAIALGSALFIVLAGWFSLAFVAPAASLSNAWDSKLGGALADTVSCNAIVKSFAAELREDERLGAVLKKWRKRTFRTWMRVAIAGVTQGTALLLLKISVLVLALGLWIYGQATAGDLTFVLTAFFLLEGYLRQVSRELHNLQRTVNDMEELAEIASKPLGISDHRDAAEIRIANPSVIFDRVTFQYTSHHEPLFSDFSVSIRSNERIGLVGPSGAGKTTFIKLLQRLYDVDAGAILIDGQDIAKATQVSLRQQIAIVPQEPILFHRSIAENIAYARPNATMSEIEQAARLANAHDFIANLPKGYSMVVGERGVKLSGGERQRVAIARAFLANASILIMDEATSSLDSNSELMIRTAMDRLMIGRTTFIIAHRLSTVQALDRLLVFDKGKIVEEGTHDQLIMRDHGVYRQLFERQAL